MNIDLPRDKYWLFTSEDQLKYNKAMLEKAIDYYNNNEITYIERLALALGISDTTVNVWAETYPEFGRICKFIKLKQKVALMDGAVEGTKNVIGSIFLLKANHGLKDQPDKDDSTNITVNTVSYKDAKKAELEEQKKAKKELKQIGLLGKAVKEAKKSKNVTQKKSK